MYLCMYDESGLPQLGKPYYQQRAKRFVPAEQGYSYDAEYDLLYWDGQIVEFAIWTPEQFSCIPKERYRKIFRKFYRVEIKGKRFTIRIRGLD